jgi:predicted kinase
MATVHLIHGFVGAGKTTFAQQLERDVEGVRFTPDDWSTALFGDEPPNPEFSARVAALIDQQWRRTVACGVDVILDFGFGTRALRDDVRCAAGTIGAQSRLYFVSCPEALLRERLHDFDALKAGFEPLQDDESYIVIQAGA